MIRRVALVLLALVVVAAVVASVVLVSWVRRPLPQTSGEITVPGLEGKVEVLRDQRGIPQIYADSDADLVTAQGYVHAQDRFFEMDLRRHVTAGRLSELVGKGGLESDRVIRTMGWRRVAEAELPLLAPHTRQLLQAYADGVNAWIRTHNGSSAALEYGLLDIDLPAYSIEEWTPVDSLAWLKAMAWDLRADYDDELARARLSDRMPEAQILQLYPRADLQERPPILSALEWSPQLSGDLVPVPGQAGPAPVPAAFSAPAAASAPAVAQIAPAGSEAAYASTMAALEAIPRLLGRGDAVGSNSWVVAGAHTRSGRPLLANDPHLAAAVPSVWYQVGLHCRSVSSNCDLDVAGFSFSGVPGVVIGHNARIAWGFTNLPADVTDFALERFNTAGKYFVDGQWQEPETREETIKVRGGADRTITVRSTRNGPVLSDVLPAVADAGDRAPTPDAQDVGRATAVSLRWTGLMPAKTADALLGFDLAGNFEEFRAAARDFAVPAQNLVYADVDGHIGYQAPGSIPVRRAAIGDIPGFWPVPGWDSRYDWQGFVPFDDLPHTLDPPEGVIVAANQTVTASSVPFLTTEFDQGYRSTRISALLADRHELNVTDMAAIQGDTHNDFAPTLVHALLEVRLDGDPFTAEARDLLRTWDFTNPTSGPQSAAAAYYNAVWSRLLRILLDDELPRDMWASGGSRWFAVVGALLEDPKSPWWDDKSTPSIIEGKDEMLRRALVEARLDLTRTLGKDPTGWRWGAVHRFDAQHKVFGGDSVPAAVRWLFDVGSPELPGGTSIVNANGWNAAQGFGVTSIPSMRMVIDLGRLDASTWVNSTGASGHPLSGNYDDQLSAWAAGEQDPWPFSRKAVVASADNTLTLLPSG